MSQSYLSINILSPVTSKLIGSTRLNKPFEILHSI